MQAQRTIKDILRKDCFIGGMSAILEDTKSLVNQEMPVYIPVSYTHLVPVSQLFFASPKAAASRPAIIWLYT